MEKEEKVVSFKSVLFKVGLVMTVFFLSRLVCGIVQIVTVPVLRDRVGVTALYIALQPLQDIFFYIIPIAFALLIFEIKKPGAFYKKPPHLTKALGNFPSVYGISQLANLLTMLAVFIISKFTPDNIDLKKAFGTMENIAPPNMICAVVLFVRMTVCAAFFEEFITRGILLNALKPYGEGFAIIVTGLLFGLMHGNFQQFFYTAAFGIALGYIAVQTDSIVPTTILHAMFNSLAAVVMLFSATDSAQKLTLGEFGDGIPDKNMLVLAFYGMFFVMMIGLVIGGVALAIRKITRLKLYRVANNWAEVKTSKKWLMFLTSVPVIIMIALAVDAFPGSVVATKIAELIT